ncbi:hypothetical protein HY385_02245 [Candidatus Daviesbacteria bacterium]|nr:hypothetical protein [Candidatus Daviesbacteria bacterium]
MPTSLRLLVIVLLAIASSVYLSNRQSPPTPVKAQAITCPQATGARIELSGTGGLLTAEDETQAPNRFATTDKCIIGSKAAVPQFSIPTFDEMKSLYFDQSKLTSKITIPGPATQGTLQAQFGSGGQKLFFVDGDLNIDGNLFPSFKAGDVVAIFVKGNLSLGSNINYTFGNSGILFIVGQDIKILNTVTAVNAFMATHGQFCSSWDNSSNSCQTSNQPLTINGSVVSLSADSAKKPQFVRSLVNNSQPAETINYQPKYLVILKGLIARDLSVWNEVQ